MKQETINIKRKQNDNVYVTSEVKQTKEVTGKPARKGLEKMIYSEGTLVNVVGAGYGHLPNENFFGEVESKLKESDIKYITRSINKDNRSFAVDYILQDDSFNVNVKSGKDQIKPMLRFTNAYDGSCKTSGFYGFYREVCSNGLTVINGEIGFSIKKRGDVQAIILPKIDGIIAQFMDNQYYSLHRIFEVMAEKPITDLNEFVKYVCGKTGLFKYEKSEKNPEPSLNAQLVLDTMQAEASKLGTRPNLWLGYNAFNEMLHNKLEKTFTAQRNADNQLFELISAM